MIDDFLRYREAFPQETVADRMIEFLNSHSDVFLREHPPGHFTGSALVTEPGLRRVALTHHRKLDRWIQFGGHADGDRILARVALREAEEESGLPDLKFLVERPFDLDIHEIPAWRDTPAHLHYDVRYLLYTERPDKLKCTEESHEVAWFTLEEARRLCGEASMHRQFDKLESIKYQMLA